MNNVILSNKAICTGGPVYFLICTRQRIFNVSLWASYRYIRRNYKKEQFLRITKRCLLDSQSHSSLLSTISVRTLKKKISDDLESSAPKIFTPISCQMSKYETKVGEDIVGKLNKDEIISILSKFFSDEDIKEIWKEQGLDQYLFQETAISFRKFCADSESLPTELHIVISDILKGACHVHDLYPYFYKHAKFIFPHLSCIDDLCKVSDLSKPPFWYPEARAMNRKIIYHAGPTNSGKTYHALEQFLTAKSGVYCGPLKLLAVEVYEKSNERGTPCDLVTGEERKYSVSEEFPANHVSCTVEMSSVNTKYDVAILDEIQMVKDPQRGWAWTRAFLGICASEVHLCGEPAAIELIQDLAMSTGEDVEVRKYKRLTPIQVEESALMSLDMCQPGDCFVCFSRVHLHKLSQSIERLGHEVAVIYGGLPPGAKLEQAKKFNDPNNPCKIMVATDAIGMGINLSIRRIIFYTLLKPCLNKNGEKEMDTISISTALQISGRAGRFGTMFPEGFVTTFQSSDLPTLKKILSQPSPTIEQAGLHPTAEQVELFAFHLPNYTLSNLLDIFVKLCSIDSNMYFICVMDDFKFLADLIQHIPLPLRSRYVFCCSPINKKHFVCALFLKFARQYSQNEPATMDWLCHQVKWPFSIPKKIDELVHLEEVFDVFDLYLWLSYRFPDMFPDTDMVRSLQSELDDVIKLGVSQITSLLRNSEDNGFSELLGKGIQKTSSQRLDPFLPESSDNNASLQRSPRLKKGKRQTLTERLLQQGIISPRMLTELKLEWKNNQYQEEIKNDQDYKSLKKKNK